MAVRRSAAARSPRALIADGERRLRALPDALHAAVVAGADWRADDPTGTTLRDIDTPGRPALISPDTRNPRRRRRGSFVRWREEAEAEGGAQPRYG